MTLSDLTDTVVQYAPYAAVGLAAASALLKPHETLSQLVVEVGYNAIKAGVETAGYALAGGVGGTFTTLGVANLAITVSDPTTRNAALFLLGVAGGMGGTIAGCAYAVGKQIL